MWQYLLRASGASARARLRHAAGRVTRGLKRRGLPAAPWGRNVVDSDAQVGKGGRGDVLNSGTNVKLWPQPGYKLPPCQAVWGFTTLSLVVCVLGAVGVSPVIPSAVLRVSSRVCRGYLFAWLRCTGTLHVSDLETTLPSSAGFHSTKPSEQTPSSG